MPPDWSRRRFLDVGGASVLFTAVSGCLVASDPSAGTLVITNNHSEGHTVTVTVTKTSNDNNDIRRHDQTPSPDTTPIWRHEEQFRVDAGTEVKREEFIAEPGAFYFEARLENGERATAWNGFYVAGDGIAEDAIFVNIQESGFVTIFGAHGD
jgi:hypothetical protein